MPALRSDDDDELEDEGGPDEDPLEGFVRPLSESGSDLPILHLPHERTAEDYQSISERILRVARRVPVISSLTWPSQVKEEFLAQGGRELPRVTYPERATQLAEAREQALGEAQQYGSDHPVDRWLRATFESYATAASMLLGIGTPEFSRHSAELYGEAGSPFLDGEATNLDLAQHLLETVDALGVPDTSEEERLDSREAAKILKSRLSSEFPAEEVRVFRSERLASKAIAGVDRIRLRKSATFTRQEIEVLVVHEGLIHVATSLNGMNQPLLRCLGRGGPRTTELQEGLAVFAEFMSGSVDLRRLRRLADRIVAIDMAQHGADFLEVYQHFLERGGAEEDAFEDTRRVFRGGVLEGGAPFTKDVVYLHGAARVRGFFEVAMSQGHMHDLERLFVGKTSLDDVELLRFLAEGGWIARPRYLPSWAKNPGLLAASLSFGTFFRRIDMEPLQEKYQNLYEDE